MSCEDGKKIGIYQQIKTVPIKGDLPNYKVLINRRMEGLNPVRLPNIARSSTARR